MAVERIIGVDFGTSTSVIRVKRYENGKPLGEKLDTKGVVFGTGMGEMVPTLIQKKDDDEKIVYYGYAAHQKRRKHTTYHSFKVDLESSDPDKRAQARKLTEEFFADMGKQYRAQSEGSHLGSTDDQERTIISYPVKWSEETKRFMIATAEKAGFPNVSGMDEAQAAIHAVTIMSEDHLRKNNLLVNGKPSNILLIDMGAGTTDLVLCRHIPGVSPKTEILTTWPKNGEILFGGREVDSLLQGFFRDVMDPEDLARAVKSVGIDQFKSWKETFVSPALAKNEAVTDFFALDNYAEIVGIEMDEYCLDRAGFEKCLGGYLKQLPELINGCLNSAGMSGSEVDLVIVTGGHSQWYFVKEMLIGKLSQFGEIGLEKIRQDTSRVIPITRPQETVALGLVYSPIQVVIAEKPVPTPLAANDNVKKTDSKLLIVNNKTKNAVEKNIISVEGHGRFQQTVGGSRQFGDLWIRVESMEERNTIVVFEKPFAHYGLNRYYAAIAQEIRSAVQEEASAINQSGLKITVYDGSYHPIDSSEYAFRKAAALALRDAMSKVNQSWVTSVPRHSRPQIDKDTTKLLDKVDISYPYGLMLIRPDKTVWSSKSIPAIQNWKNIRGVWDTSSIFGLREDGTVVAIGKHQYDVSGWCNIRAIAGSSSHTVGLREDGTVVATGKNDDGQCDVSGWRNIRAIACGWHHTVGLREDGTVVATGKNDDGQCDVSGWRNIGAIVCSMSHTIGLREDGTVVATGRNSDGKCNVSAWRNIRAIACGLSHTVGLREDGTVVATGCNLYGQCNVSGWHNIRAIACGLSHTTVGLREDGTVVAAGSNEYGQCNVSDWRDIIAIKETGDHTIGIQRDGRVRYTQYEMVENKKTFLGFELGSSSYKAIALPSQITPVSVF